MKKVLIGIALLLLLVVVACNTGSDDAAPIEEVTTEEVN